ncbi:MAG: hypothetical protein EA355_06475 [Rhodobacteraceae bacterium]|nr:MAG: hypothetical protein EA355_06475 [Paracoccaceae bacterium]
MLPRTIPLDRSDGFVFPSAAASGERAVTGAFLFEGLDVEALPRKRRTAFGAGCLGVASFGFSTPITAVEATEEDRAEAIETLAAGLVARLGAEEEIAFAASLARDHAPNTLIALHRTVEQGRIREQFRTLRPREAEAPGAIPQSHARAFLILQTDEEPEERVDLLSLGRG